MARTVGDEPARLEDDRRATMKMRAAALIAESPARRDLRSTEAPHRARGRQV